jgi:hypothetical protein
MLLMALGLWAAPKVGLDAPVVRAWAEGKSLWPALRRSSFRPYLPGRRAPCW